MSGFGQAATGLISADIGASGAKDASRAQVEESQLGLSQLRDIYNNNKGKFDPYIDTGNQAETELQRGMGPNGYLGRRFTLADFNKDPAYQFDVQQGLLAINNSNSVRGGALSGGTLKALSNYAQQQASNEFGNARDYFVRNQNQNFGQLSSLAGQGLNATQAQANLGERFGEAQMGQLNDIGTAKASGILGAAQAWQTGINQFGQGISSSMSGGGITSLGSALGS